MAEEKIRFSRRTFLKRAGLGLLSAGALGALDAGLERFWVHTRELKLPVRGLPEPFKGWRIVQFSDTHFGFHYDGEHFRNVVRIINGHNPDIVFFTGDLIDREWLNTPSSKVLPALQELHTPRGGKWAVLGNHDYAARQEAIELLRQAGFRVLINANGFVEEQGQRICIAGTDEYMFGRFDMKKTLEGKAANDCVLLLAHEPDLADISATYGVNAQFSGHSHGGQIRKPFSQPFFTPELGKKYTDGLYSVGDRKMPLYVNRGIGTSFLPIRMFCRPEVTLFHLM
ncbi:metallophosphoesterase [Paenibacillus chartarius]|uniref:Metallophosphoesterase n=1 Tax=Paenibacillus chartarius TaxID=747481 RepID=A0ABV6DUY7_9BACL